MYNDLMDTLGEYLLRLIQKEGISQNELARRSSVSTAEISRIISGQRQKPAQKILLNFAKVLHVDPRDLLRIAGYVITIEDISQLNTEQTSSGENTSLTPIIQRMFQRRRLRGIPQIVVFTGGALTADEIRQLEKGASPASIPEDRMVQFLRKFDLDDIRDYYRAAGVPLPQAFQDLEADLREVLHRVRMSTDGSPEALEYVIQLAKETFGEDGNKKTK